MFLSHSASLPASLTPQHKSGGEQIWGNTNDIMPAFQSLALRVVGRAEVPVASQQLAESPGVWFPQLGQPHILGVPGGSSSSCFLMEVCPLDPDILSYLYANPFLSVFRAA